MYHSSPLRSDSSIVSLYKHIKKKKKEKIWISVPIPWPQLCHFSLFSIFPKRRGSGNRERERERQGQIDFDSLSGVAFVTGDKDFVLAWSLEQEVWDNSCGFLSLELGQPFLPFGGSDYILLALQRNPLQPQFPDLNKEVVELDKL